MSYECIVYILARLLKKGDSISIGFFVFFFFFFFFFIFYKIRKFPGKKIPNDGRPLVRRPFKAIFVDHF